LIVCSPAAPYEYEVARRWWALVPGTILPLQNGVRYQLLFGGRTGSAAGPDVRDAVFAVLGDDMVAVGRCVGDVEFHIRTSDWKRHQHDRDSRYNAVVLHVVLIGDEDQPTRKQNGSSIPICVLTDVPLRALRPSVSDMVIVWPCHHIITQLSQTERDQWLERIGVLRFEQKAHAFVERLHRLMDDVSAVRNNQYDFCLVIALAEGLAYGRDRELFYAIGVRLWEGKGLVPEPSGRADFPSPLDAQRLRALGKIVACGRTHGIWHMFCEILLASDDEDTTVTALREELTLFGLSLARVDILIVNVVLPFAAAVAIIEQRFWLGERAQAVYMAHPGLSSNRITRMMRDQLLLPHEPGGSCRQQALHYVYQQTCREKRCDICVFSKNDI